MNSKNTPTHTTWGDDGGEENKNVTKDKEPLQDILGLGSEARMNIPGKTGGNWRWRFTSDMLTDEIKVRLRELTRLYGR